MKRKQKDGGGFWVEVSREGDTSGARIDFGQLHKFKTRLGAVAFGTRFVELFYDTMADEKYTKKRLNLPDVANALLSGGNVICMGHEFLVCGGK